MEIIETLKEKSKDLWKIILNKIFRDQIDVLNFLAALIFIFLVSLAISF